MNGSTQSLIVRGGKHGTAKPQIRRVIIFLHPDTVRIAFPEVKHAPSITVVRCSAEPPSGFAWVVFNATPF